MAERLADDVGPVRAPDRAARARERAALAESRAARDPEGGLAQHWVAHAWRRCAAACGHGTAADASLARAPVAGSELPDAWEAVAAAWEAAAAAWLAVAIAQRRLEAARRDEDADGSDWGPRHDRGEAPWSAVSERVAALAEARRGAEGTVRDAERLERVATF